MIELTVPAPIRLPLPAIEVGERLVARAPEVVVVSPSASELRFDGLSEADLALLGPRRAFGLPFEMRVELLPLVETDDDTLEHFRGTHSVAEEHLQSIGVPYLQERRVVTIERGPWGRVVLYDLVRLGFEVGTNTAYLFPTDWTRGAIHLGPLHYHQIGWDEVRVG